MVAVKGSPMSALVNRVFSAGSRHFRFATESRSALPPRANFFSRSRKIIGLTFGSLVASRMSGKPRYPVFKKVAKGSTAASLAHMRPLAKRRATTRNPEGDCFGIAGSVRTIAAQLNMRGILTPRGGAWHPTSAARLLSRLQATPP